MTKNNYKIVNNKKKNINIQYKNLLKKPVIFVILSYQITFLIYRVHCEAI